MAESPPPGVERNSGNKQSLVHDGGADDRCARVGASAIQSLQLGRIRLYGDGFRGYVLPAFRDIGPEPPGCVCGPAVDAALRRVQMAFSRVRRRHLGLGYLLRDFHIVRHGSVPRRLTIGVDSTVDDHRRHEPPIYRHRWIREGVPDRGHLAVCAILPVASSRAPATIVRLDAIADNLPGIHQAFSREHSCSLQVLH